MTVFWRILSILVAFPCLGEEAITVPSCHHAMHRHNSATPKIADIKQKPCKQVLLEGLGGKNSQSLVGFSKQKWRNVSYASPPTKSHNFGKFLQTNGGKCEFTHSLGIMHNHLRHFPTINLVNFSKLVFQDREGKTVNFVNFCKRCWGKLSLQNHKTL